MDAVSTHTAHSAPAHEDHAHPGPMVYLKIGLALFIFTALEVAAFEVAHRAGSSFGAALKPVLVPVLLGLSAFKFALVAMYYMHLKPDHKLFTLIFVFSLMIAAVAIVALMALFHYQYSLGF